MAQIGIVRAINDQTRWRITVTNGPVPNTNVAVVFTLPVEFSIDSDTIVPAGTLVGTTWTIGAMTAGQVLSADIILQFDGPVPGISESFDITAVVSGTGDTEAGNNTKTDSILFEIVSCDPLASGSACVAGLKFDLSECSTPCTMGATPEWVIVADSEANVVILDFDATTGIGYYSFIDPSLPGSFTWGLNCILGEDTIVICASYTMTLYPIIDDKDVFDHSADYVLGSTLTAEEILILQAQPAYAGLSDVQIQALCWETLYNADDDLVGGWAHDCTGSQDNRHFVFCSEVECTDPEVECPACPYTDMPADVALYLASITDYTAESGDVITIYHPGAISVYEYNGTAWVRSSCGCITFLNNPYPVAFTVTGGTTKTATITLSDTTTLVSVFTDIDTNTTYTLTYVTILGLNYIRLIDNSGNIVSSIMLPSSSGTCCCDCTFNLIPTTEGAIASTNCDIDWEVDAIWESRPAIGDEGDWAALDGGYHEGEYNNGCVGCLIRVRYTLDECERFSNIVSVTSCPCWAEITIEGVTTIEEEVIDDIFDHAGIITDLRLNTENCTAVFDVADFEWQLRNNFGTWVTIQTGGAGIDLQALLVVDPTLFDDVVANSIQFRGMYEDAFGCRHYTNTQGFIIPIELP